MKEAYDLAIIGGGSAGLTAADLAVQLGRRVALVEKYRLGGDCTWTGCVPSKTLLRVARTAQEMRTAGLQGLAPAQPEVDLGRVMAHVRSVVEGVYQQESIESMRGSGVDVYVGDARFLGPHTLAAGEDVLTSRKFLVATGARPYAPPIPGLESVDYLTYESIWNLEVLPQHLIVVGGGPIGCEMAQAFRRLGSRVTLIEALDRLLPLDDPEASRVIAARLCQEGVVLRTSTPLEKAWQDGDGVHVEAGGHEDSGDALLMAVGRRPNVGDLALEEAGVEFSQRGIQVDGRLRTSRKHIFAAGDCTGGYQFTHYAGWQGFMAVRNAFLPGWKRGIAQRVPWATFTDPEVAQVGLTEAQARQSLGDRVMTCTWPMEQVDRARVEGDTSGFLKLVHRRDGTLLGATVVAARAGEMVHEWVLALDRGLRIGDVASSLHVYPTYSMASMQAAAHIRVSQLLGGVTGRAVRGVARLMR